MDLITAENVVTLILGVLSCGLYEAIISSSNKLKNCLDGEKDFGDFLEIKVALAHPAASNGVCSRHRSKTP